LRAFHGAENFAAEFFPVAELRKAAAEGFGLAGAAGDGFFVGGFQLLGEFVDHFFLPAVVQGKAAQFFADDFFPIRHFAPPQCD